jgi:hypothetical protein
VTYVTMIDGGGVFEVEGFDAHEAAELAVEEALERLDLDGGTQEARVYVYDGAAFTVWEVAIEWSPTTRAKAPVLAYVPTGEARELLDAWRQKGGDL